MNRITMMALAGILLLSGCKAYKWQTTDRHEDILVGKISRKLLNDDTRFPWMKKNYDLYNHAESTDILFLKAYNNRVTFLVFAGTWCDDSQILLPRFFRVLDEAGFPQKAVTLYGTNRSKETLKKEAAKNNIKKLPTIIVFKDGKEIGRIEETVRKSIEVDLKEMLLKTLN